jgi:iron complex outermembrane receptor protein
LAYQQKPNKWDRTGDIMSRRRGNDFRRASPLSATCLGLCLLGGAGVLAPAANAQQSGIQDEQSYDLPGGPLGEVLSRFAAQAGILLSCDAVLTSGQASPGLEGRYTVSQALDRLLSGTELTYRFADANTVVLARAAPPMEGELAPLTVTASRSPRPQSSIPGAITVIDEEQIDKQRAISRDIQRILQQSVPGFRGPTGTRQSGNVALRGRNALVLQNGVPQNQQLRSAGYDFRNIDPRHIERIEVVRGANATYGFGGTGGLINIITKRPDSPVPLYTLELGTSFQPHEFSAADLTRELYASVEGRSGAFDYLVSASARDLENVYDADGDRIPDFNNEYNSDIYDFYTSLGWQIDEERSLRLTANYFREEEEDDKAGPANAVVGERKADTVPAEQAFPAFPTGRFADPMQSTNVQLTYEDVDIAGSAVSVQGFWQQWENRTFSDFTSFGACCTLDRGEDNRIDRRLGARFNIDSPLTLGGLPEGTRLVWGADALNLYNSELIASEISGEDVGSRPDLTQNSLAGFAQLEVPVGAWLLSGGVRHEEFDVEFDDVIKGDGSRFEGGDIRYDATLWNLGAVYFLTDTVELFGGFSQGFDVTQAGRAAAAVNSVDQVRLEPAVTDGYELGVRTFRERWDASLTAFYTKSELGSRTRTNPSGTLALPLRQPERIWGAEATLGFQYDERWRFGGTLAYQKGERRVEDEGWEPLQSIFIQPWRATAFAVYEPNGRWTHRLQAVYAPGHDRFDEASTEYGEGEVSTLFLLDYFGSVATAYGEFRIGVQNLLNRQYVPQFREATNVASNYYAAPGRTVRLTWRKHF